VRTSRSPWPWRRPFGDERLWAERAGNVARTGAAMAKKGSKASRKFAASGQLKKKIHARRKHQQIQRKVDKNKNAKNKGRERARVDASQAESEEEEDTKEIKSLKKRYYLSQRWCSSLHADAGCSLKGMSADDFLGASFMEEDEDVSLSWISP
jgi:nucleolar complex protein 2